MTLTRHFLWLLECRRKLEVSVEQMATSLACIKGQGKLGQWGQWGQWGHGTEPSTKWVLPPEANQMSGQLAICSKFFFINNPLPA